MRRNYMYDGQGVKIREILSYFNINSQQLISLITGGPKFSSSFMEDEEGLSARFRLTLRLKLFESVVL
jgi:hypothetical protein